MHLPKWPKSPSNDSILWPAWTSRAEAQVPRPPLMHGGELPPCSATGLGQACPRESLSQKFNKLL